MYSEVINRLENWKFNDAWNLMIDIDGDDDEVRQVVGSLAVSYGNCGWFRGHQGIIVGEAVSSVIEELRRLDT